MTNVPIRFRLTVLRDGSTSSEPMAFCAAEGSTVPLSRCAMCGFATRFARDAHRQFSAVTCERVVAPRRSPDESGDQPARDRRPPVTVGLALTRAFVCLAEDTPLGLVTGFFESDSTAFGLPVVDARGALVGTLARATAALARATSTHAGRAIGDMVVAPHVESERAGLAEAFASMSERAVGEVTVLGDGHAPVGVLRDIDALRAVAALLGRDSAVKLAG